MATNIALEEIFAGLVGSLLANATIDVLRPFAQRVGELLSNRYSRYRVEVLKDLLEVIDLGQYPSFLQAESRHEITFGAVLLAAGAVFTRVEPVVGIKNGTEYVEIATFAIGFYLALQATLKLRRMYPRRVRAKRAIIAAELQKLESRLSAAE